MDDTKTVADIEATLRRLEAVKNAQVAMHEALRTLGEKDRISLLKDFWNEYRPRRKAAD